MFGAAMLAVLLLAAIAQSPASPSPSPTPEASPSPVLSPAPTPAPPPEPAADASGTWKGTTSQGKELEIEIEANEVKWIRVGWQIAFDGDCVPPEGGPAERRREGTHLMRYQYPETVKAGRLKTRFGIGRDLDLLFTGTFLANASASGDVDLGTIESSPCAGKLKATWTANRK